MDDVLFNQTGSSNIIEETRIVESQIGDYKITIRVNSRNEFLEIISVKINTDFYDHKTRINANFKEAEELYK